MRIAIAARGLSQSQGGVKEYIRNLTLQFPVIDAENQFFFYYSSDEHKLNLKFPNVQEIVLPMAPNFIWDHLILPQRLKQDKIDVTLFPKGTIPFIYSGQAVVTEHDLGYFFPGLKAYKFIDTLYARFMIPRAIRKAQAIVAVSHHTKGDILRFVRGADEQKIYVIYEAAPVRDDSSCSIVFTQRLEELGPYIFYSGSLSPRKNLERALNAFNLIKNRIPHQFVMTGGKQWGDSIEKFIIANNLQDRVALLGYLNDGELARVYKRSALYFMPSLYEGFSMTILEAMQSGCPVVASNVSSHPEVVGDAGILFDPYSVNSMAETLLSVLNNSNLQDSLKERGFVQASRFSWKKCAQETLTIIREVHNRNA